jgi:hypothetical protein
VRSRLITAGVVATLAVLALGAATHFEPIPFGLHSDIVAGRERLSDAVCPLRDGDYTFSTGAATPATIVVDGQPVTGPVYLTAGAHGLLIEREYPDGVQPLSLRWSRNGGSTEDVPKWALRPRKVRGIARLGIDAGLVVALAASEWVWVGLLVAIAALAAGAGLSRIRTSLARVVDWRTLRWILAASLLLNVAGIGWGLPGTWVAIELKPQYILGALEQHFSHGWFDAYPPVHFYVLSTAWSPLLLLKYLGRLTFETPVEYSLLVVVSRLVSVAMAAAIVAAACVCGTRAFGRRAGLFAAAIVASTTPFLYYAKTANVDVPYIFWWTLSMVCYLRLLERGRTRDYVLFGAAAALSVCTKDQAYGLYLLVPLVLLEQIWRTNRQAAVDRAFLRALFDGRLIAGAIASAVLFVIANNILFNLSGFIAHVQFITGPGSAAYRVYEPTLAGHLALLRTSVRLTELSMGWPLFFVSVVGLLIAFATPSQRRVAIWLVVPVVSYYLGFINVVLYNYDRFMLPVCFILAIFGGLALARLLSFRWGSAVPAIAFAYTLLYAATVDVLMLRDSRYEAEQWMAAHVAPTDLVAVSGLHEYLPRIDAYHLEEIATVPDLRQEHPEYVVLNADYARAVPLDTEWGQMIAGLQQHTLGYRRVAQFRHPAAWPWLPGGHPDLVGARQETIVFSTLRNINPTIEIFQRER